MAIFLLLVSVWVLGFAWCLSPGPFGRLPGIMSLGWARAGSGLLSLDSARLEMCVGSAGAGLPRLGSVRLGKRMGLGRGGELRGDFGVEFGGVVRSGKFRHFHD